MCDILLKTVAAQKHLTRRRGKFPQAFPHLISLLRNIPSPQDQQIPGKNLDLNLIKKAIVVLESTFFFALHLNSVEKRHSKSLFPKHKPL